MVDSQGLGPTFPLGTPPAATKGYLGLDRAMSWKCYGVVINIMVDSQGLGPTFPLGTLLPTAATKEYLGLDRAMSWKCYGVVINIPL
jgi:hypothetical protein